MLTASVRWTGQQKFEAISPTGHTVLFDGDSQSHSATSPMDMLLMALGACTATDIVIILGKKRQKFDALEVLCSGERAASPPRIWTKLDVLFRIRGTVNETAFEHALELTKEKYCSVAAMLRETADITWRYEIQR